jgi:2'-5' RNA ligase
MDVSNLPESSGVMIAFLPTTSDWCELDLPHMTLVYAGDKAKLGPNDFNSLAKDAAALAQLTRPFAMRVKRVEVFGDTEKVNVLSFLASPEILAMRRYVERWNASQYSFNPHSTIGPVSSFLPEMPTVVRFDRIMVGWGEESLVFWLNNQYV